MQPSDIITAVGETTLDATNACINTLYQYAPGDTVTLTLMRGNQQMQPEVTSGETES